MHTDIETGIHTHTHTHHTHTYKLTRQTRTERDRHMQRRGVHLDCKLQQTATDACRHTAPPRLYTTTDAHRQQQLRHCILQQGHTDTLQLAIKIQRRSTNKIKKKMQRRKECKGTFFFGSNKNRGRRPDHLASHYHLA